MSTQNVLDHHLQAFGAGDVNAVLEDFADDAVLVTPDGQQKGKEAIGAVFSSFFGGLFAPGTYEIAIDSMETNGDVGYITWHATTKTHEIPLGTDTFVIENGKIAVQTLAVHMIEK